MGGHRAALDGGAALRSAQEGLWSGETKETRRADQTRRKGDDIMTAETFVVAYEGDSGSGRLLDYAIRRALKDGAKLKIVHVLEWSPYKFLTADELEERHARRRSEMERAQRAILDPAVKLAEEAGVETEAEMRYGAVVDLIADIARSSGASMIFVGRSGGNSISARIFGSVPLGLAQVAPVPVIIVP